VDRDPSGDYAADEARHDLAVALVLAAADADAAVGDFSSALKWLSFVEQLNLVIPSEYVAKRHEWRRQLDPGATPDVAAARIDPSFRSGAAAISDLQRRLGWLRELEERNEGEMRDHLSTLNEGMNHLIALSRRSGTLEGRHRRDRDEAPG
jgi:hypothetical protein